VRDGIANDFDLHSVSYYADDPACRELLPPTRDPEETHQIWAERLYDKGVSQEDIQFLYDVLDPDPTQRLTAEDICRMGYLDASVEVAKERFRERVAGLSSD